MHNLSLFLTFCSPVLLSSWNTLFLRRSPGEDSAKHLYAPALWEPFLRYPFNQIFPCLSVHSRKKNYHSGRNHYKIIPWDHYFCNMFVVFFKSPSAKTPFKPDRVSFCNPIRGNRTRNSERKMALWEGLWEGLWKKPLKNLNTSESPPSQRPSQNLSGLLPPFLLPLDLTKKLLRLLLGDSLRRLQEPSPWNQKKTLRCSKLEPFCDTEKWRIWGNDPKTDVKISQSSPNSLVRAQFPPKFAKFLPKFCKTCEISRGLRPQGPPRVRKKSGQGLEESGKKSRETFFTDFLVFSSWMQSAFVTIAKRIASENDYCKEVFCNNFGRGGSGN